MDKRRLALAGSACGCAVLAVVALAVTVGLVLWHEAARPDSSQAGPPPAAAPSPTPAPRQLPLRQLNSLRRIHATIPEFSCIPPAARPGLTSAFASLITASETGALSSEEYEAAIDGWGGILADGEVTVAEAAGFERLTAALVRE